VIAAQTIPAAPAPPQGAPSPAPIYSPALKPLPQQPQWKSGMYQGATDSAGHRFVIANLDVLQPVAIMLISAKPEDDLTLRLFRDDFKTPLREASTGDHSTARFQIRTEGDLRMTVTSKQGVKPYQLLVLVGDEVKVPVPSLFVPISYAGAPAPTGAAARTAAGAPATGGASSGTSAITWIIAGSLLVIIILLAAILFRKKNVQKTAALIVAIALPALAPLSLSAQAPSPPAPISVADSWKQDAAALIEELVKQNDKAAEILKLFEALGPSDDGLWPQYTPPGMPGIPTACVAAIPQGVAKSINEVSWTNPECAECYKAAHEEIAKTLQRFEKLRRVDARTKEVYETAMTFGNGVAMVGGIITTAEWMKIRNGIKANMEKYYGTYDAKVVELTDALVAALQKVAACELKYFSNASWYERYGFMFVNPVVERHRR
jgi:hypothetical protein